MSLLQNEEYVYALISYILCIRRRVFFLQREALVLSRIKFPTLAAADVLPSA